MSEFEPSQFEGGEDQQEGAAREREDFQTRRRLRKALALAERFKHKYHLEQQVSSELARRCDELKTQRKSDLALVDRLTEDINRLQIQLRDQAGTCSQSLPTPTLIPASNTVTAAATAAAATATVTTGPSRAVPDLNSLEILKDCSFDDDLFEDMRRSSIIVKERPEIRNISEVKSVIEKLVLEVKSPRTSEKAPPSTAASLSSLKVAARLKSRDSAAKLFEHFLVVGASDQAACVLSLLLPTSRPDGKASCNGKDSPSIDATEDLKMDSKVNLMRRISDMMYPFSNSSSPVPGPTVSDLNTAATVTASSSPLISPPGLRLSDDAFSVRTDGGTDVLIQSLRALELPHDSASASAGPLSSPLTRTRDFPSPGSCNSVVSLDPLPLPPQHPITLPMPQPLSLPPAPLSAVSTYTSTANRIQGHLSTIEKSRANAGAYSVPAEVLYRYTDPKGSAAAASVAPKDVADFCLPLGGLLSPIPGSPGINVSEAETHNSSASSSSPSSSSLVHGAGDKTRRTKSVSLSLSRRSCVRHTSKEYAADCFVFVLDDKTIAPDVTKSNTESDAQHPGKRLYGICVQQVRTITVPYSHTVDPISPGTDTDDREVSDSTPASVEFESKVCFAFVTHYPFIQFFFQVIHEILAADSASRLIVADEKENEKEKEKGARSGSGKEKNFMVIEDYIPRSLLDEMLGRLSGLKAPSYGAHLSFRTNLGVLGKKEIRVRRFCSSIDSAATGAVTGAGTVEQGVITQHAPPKTLPLPLPLPLMQSELEYRWMTASWSLEVLLSPMALSVELLVRVLGLLLCEAKVVVIGSDLCLVSAAIMGLQSLMRPLEWVAPAISILPHKLAEFLECPVPLLAGLVVDTLEPQLQSLRNMSSSNTSTSFYFSSKELQSEFSVGDVDTGGVKCSPGTLKAASLRAAKLLIQCGDGTDSSDSEEGMLSAVLDMDEVELYLSGRHSSPENKDQLVMPGAQQLVDSLKACLSEAYSSQRVTDEESTTDSCEPCSLSDRKKDRELKMESKIEKMASRSVQVVVSQHIQWLLSLTAKAKYDVAVACTVPEEHSAVDEHSSPVGTASVSSSNRNNHASTFEEVMSLADEEDEVLTQKLSQQHSVSMEKVLTNISEKNRGSEGRRSLSRAASLPQVDTVRNSLRRFLTGNSIPPASSESRSKRPNGGANAAHRDRDSGGGMSVLLMSQELSMQDNQEAFLRRFTSTQMFSEYVPPVDRTTSSAVVTSASATSSIEPAAAGSLPAPKSAAPRLLTVSPPSSPGPSGPNSDASSTSVLRPHAMRSVH